MWTRAATSTRWASATCWARCWTRWVRSWRNGSDGYGHISLVAPPSSCVGILEAHRTPGVQSSGWNRMGAILANGLRDHRISDL